MSLANIRGADRFNIEHVRQTWWVHGVCWRGKIMRSTVKSVNRSAINLSAMSAYLAVAMIRAPNPTASSHRA
jgi:hypothetical protein